MQGFYISVQPMYSQKIPMSCDHIHKTDKGWVNLKLIQNMLQNLNLEYVAFLKT